MSDILSPDVLLPAVVLVPLLGAAVAVASARAAAATAVITALLTAAIAVLLGRAVVAGGAVTHAAGAWGAPLGIEMHADGVAVLLLVVTAAIGICITVYATSYFRPIFEDEEDRGVRFFWPLWLLIWAALNAIFVATDLFNLYVCLELLTLPAVAMVALDGDREAVAAATRYLLLSIAGSLLFLLGVAIVYSGSGTLALAAIRESGMDARAAATALTLMTTGLAVKAALVPLHVWLPPAHAGAPAPGSAVLSGLVVKAAFIIVLRLWTEAFPGSLLAPGADLLGVLGAIAVLWGSLLALRQQRVKLVIAYSTVAQVGYLFLVFPLLLEAPGPAWSGTMYHLLSHALAKAALFLAAGAMLRAMGSDRLDDIAGVGQKLPMTFAAFGIAGLNLAGMPPSGGFIGKWLLLTAALSSGQWWWAVVIAIGSLLAAAYVLLVLRAAFLQPRARPLRHQPPWQLTAPALALALLSVVLGVWAEPPLLLLGATAPDLAP
ncbi:MAG TPA: proton-conducting transporter membrane subunit [Longimicrobiales bacterium]|nr:proton-conducting transporter membrane subunit [Longimicrobiales bacterium]